MDESGGVYAGAGEHAFGEVGRCAIMRHKFLVSVLDGL